ncbi:MAG: hypothetical protein ACFFG0_09205 [Candidatus Thorarchaeota archaeon]
MNLAKDIMLCILFACMFCVVLIGAYLQYDLITIDKCNNSIIDAQLSVIKEDLIKIRAQEAKIKALRCESLDLQEVLAVIQREKSVIKSKYKELERDLTRTKIELAKIKIEYKKLEELKDDTE